MRIITGTLKGRRITVPRNVSLRPTSDRAKESIFSIIDVHKHLTGSVVLDLFAGSGNLGFEAISRGTQEVFYVESEKRAAEHIEKTAGEFGVKEKIHGICAAVEHYLRGPTRSFDLVFADPPYDFEELEQLPDIILEHGWLKEDGWFILEHDKRHSFFDHSHCFLTKAYGRTIVSFFSNHPAEK